MAKHLRWASLALIAFCGCDSKGTSQGNVEDTCARLSTCGLLTDSRMSFGECVYLLNVLEISLIRGTSASTDAQSSQHAYDCLLDASTCDEMVACSRPTSEQLAACDSGHFTVCSGNVLISCSPEPQKAVARDCGKAGLVCGTSPNGAWCGLSTCDPATTAPRCEGNSLFSCQKQGNVLISEDCAERGKVCGKMPDGTVGCVGEVACDDRSSDMHCEGSVKVICEDGTESRRDCAQLGDDWTCASRTEEGGISMGCVPVSKECSIGLGESCSGGVIHYCNAGHPASYDCTSAGFPGCTTTKGVAGCMK